MHSIRQWSIMEPANKPSYCILGLAGRNTPSEPMMELCADLGLKNELAIGIRASRYAWYPQPISSLMQGAAVAGLEPARLQVEKALDRINHSWGISRENIVLLGFSAGAVMSIYTAMHSKLPFKAVVSLAGAVLEPERIPACQHPEMPIILQHNQDDRCFDWDERYLPMRNGLKDKGYNILALERQRGGHAVNHRDMMVLGEYLAPKMGYGKDWVHPGLKNLWQEREQEILDSIGQVVGE